MPFKTTSNDESPSTFDMLVILVLCVIAYLALPPHPLLQLGLVLVGGVMVLMMCASCITRVASKPHDDGLIMLPLSEGECPKKPSKGHVISDGDGRSSCIRCGAGPLIY